MVINKKEIKMGTVIKNVKLVLPKGKIIRGTIKWDKGKIVSVSEGEILSSVEDQVIDGMDLYLSPGFIDLHTHGGGGYDFMDGTVEAFLKSAEMHAKHGTTSLLPTTLTSTNEELYLMFEIYKIAKSCNCLLIISEPVLWVCIWKVLIFRLISEELKTQNI